ncbi:hypothetical protein HDU80_007256 [Chytriomyces hyalinus]|nr:hypothetical protein HDU80_007256 [Chytriomyces hyalinus]
MHDPSANRTSDETLEAEAIEDVAELLSHFQSYSACWPNSNLLLCAMLFSTSVAVILNNFDVMEKSQAINIAANVANGSGKVSFTSFAWVRTRKILDFESHQYTYQFSYYFCALGKRNRARIPLDSKSYEQPQIARSYSIVSGRQLAATFAFVVEKTQLSSTGCGAKQLRV